MGEPRSKRRSQPAWIGVPLRAICGGFFGIITTEVLLRVHVSGGRLLVKLRVEIITKVLAQASKGVFSLLPQLLPLSGGRNWWMCGLRNWKVEGSAI
jgi:hypothetical protein